jgi:hypothetical protein
MHEIAEFVTEKSVLWENESRKGKTGRNVQAFAMNSDTKPEPKWFKGS